MSEIVLNSSLPLLFQVNFLVLVRYMLGNIFFDGLLGCTGIAHQNWLIALILVVHVLSLFDLDLLLSSLLFVYSPFYLFRFCAQSPEISFINIMVSRFLGLSNCNYLCSTSSPCLLGLGLEISISIWGFRLEL